MKLKTTTGYTDMATDAMCSTLEKEMSLFTDVEAKQHGLEGKPQHLPEWSAIYLNKVQSTLQGGIDKNAQLLPVSGVVVAQKGESEATDAIQPLEASLKDGELKFRQLEERKKEGTPDLRKRLVRKIVYMAASIIAIAEGFFAYEGLRRASLAKFPSFISSVGITVALAFGTHILAGYIRKSTTRLQWITRFCISVIPVFCGLQALGNLRANGYTTAAQMNLSVEQNTIPQAEVSGLAITTLSFLLFLAALLFSIKFYKSKSEAEFEAAYDKACKELKEHQDKMNGIQQSIDTIKQNARAESAQALAKYEFSITIENRLKNLAKQLINDYIIKNLRFRKDGTTPEFFSNPPELTFRTFFDNVKTNQS